MINSKIIEEVKKRLVNTYNPLEIYLFGSYAWGCPDEESDLDLLVVVQDYKTNWHQDVIEGHKALFGMGIPKDILLYTKKQFDQASQDQSSFCYKIVHKGKKIYAKA